LAGLLLFPHRTLRTRSLPLRPHLSDQRLAPARRLSQGPRQPRSRALPDCPPIPRSRCHPQCHRNPPPRSPLLPPRSDGSARAAPRPAAAGRSIGARAGMSLPMIKFSFRPSRWSVLPEIAASVRTRVVSWKDAAAMQAYLASDLGKGVVGNPNFANLTSRDFEVLSGPTTSSGGPVAASLTATASLTS
jgi:hypothetical protein